MASLHRHHVWLFGMWRNKIPSFTFFSPPSLTKPKKYCRSNKPRESRLVLTFLCIGRFFEKRTHTTRTIFSFLFLVLHSPLVWSCPFFACLSHLGSFCLASLNGLLEHRANRQRQGLLLSLGFLLQARQVTVKKTISGWSELAKLINSTRINCLLNKYYMHIFY